MLHAMALVTFSLNKIVESLFHLLATDGIDDVPQDTFTRTVRLYDGFNSRFKFSFLPFPKIPRKNTYF